MNEDGKTVQIYWKEMKWYILREMKLCLLYN